LLQLLYLMFISFLLQEECGNSVLQFMIFLCQTVDPGLVVLLFQPEMLYHCLQFLFFSSYFGQLRFVCILLEPEMLNR
jgi:hypothetical protein